MDGDVVRLWFSLAAEALATTRSAIDLLNVFPVPDADTGTNLHRTIASAAEAVTCLPAATCAADIWQAAATAALRGACGNSGIIMSQLLRGLAEVCGPASPCDGQVVAVAIARGAVLARAAVHRPLEGTVLTVADAAARAAAQASDLAAVGRAAALGAREALARTQQQLEALALGGVVDAGGAGLCVMLDALSAAISGSRPGGYEVPAPLARPAPAQARPAAAPAGGHTERASAATARPPGYEVTFLLEAAEPAVAGLRARLALLGDSLVVSGGDGLWHVHVHVADAGAAVEAGLTAGRTSKITITWLNEAPPAAPAASRPDGSRVVVVAEGAGLIRLLAGAGATVIESPAAEGVDGPVVDGPAVDGPVVDGPVVDGPVVDDAAGDGAAVEGAGLQAALDAASSSGQAVLIAAPGVAAGRWPPGWPVIEVGSPVQAIAALAVHDPERELAGDAAAMRRAVAGMRWAALAAGPAAPATGAAQAAAATAVADLLAGPGTEMLTVLTGRHARPGLAAAVAAHVGAAAPGVEVVCYDGGMTDAIAAIGAE